MIPSLPKVANKVLARNDEAIPDGESR
jgi:hypothetical protein